MPAVSTWICCSCFTAALMRQRKDASVSFSRHARACCVILAATHARASACVTQRKHVLLRAASFSITTYPVLNARALSHVPYRHDDNQCECKACASIRSGELDIPLHASLRTIHLFIEARSQRGRGAPDCCAKAVFICCCIISSCSLLLVSSSEN